jgi:GDP-D-mannose 3',5'-epimerase
MRSEFQGRLNVGSDEMVTINQLADMTMAIAGSDRRSDTSGPLGVRGRNSDNRLKHEVLGRNLDSRIE